MTKDVGITDTFYLRVGDTIKCHDKDDLITTMQNLLVEGVDSDFLYELNGIKGYYLIITKV